MPRLKTRLTGANLSMYNSEIYQLIDTLLYRLHELEGLSGAWKAANARAKRTVDMTTDESRDTFNNALRKQVRTVTSFRTVPLWPQLEEILRAFVFGTARAPGRLLFPSYRTGSEAILTDLRKLLDAVATRAGWRAGDIRSKMFRHTYTAARLQTLDAGAPVSVYTVAKELGHGGESMVRRVYGHLGQVRHRSDAVEYRVEQFTGVLGDRLSAVEGGK